MSAQTPNDEAAARPPAALTEYAAFTAETVHRSLLKAAAYNPRTITESARKKLKANLARIGLIQPIVWNRRTGHVVGGHQKLKCLDALECHADYLVPVAVVDFDDQTEKAQNVFLNNGEAQGEWDLLKLAEVFTDIPEPTLTGFDSGDLYAMFGRDVTKERLPDLLDPEPAAAPDESGRDEADDETPLERKKDWERRERESAEREPGDFFHVVVHKSDKDRDEFERRFGLKPGRYIDPATLVAAIKNG